MSTKPDPDAKVNATDKKRKHVDKKDKGDTSSTILPDVMTTDQVFKRLRIGGLNELVLNKCDPVDTSNVKQEPSDGNTAVADAGCLAQGCPPRLWKAVRLVNVSFACADGVDVVCMASVEDADGQNT